jgi:ADP-heptose:LPS heptosyltransferase
MHLGSALGTPTLGLFSDSLPEHYHPVGAADRWIRGVPIEAIGVSEVLEVLEEMRGGIPN